MNSNLFSSRRILVMVIGVFLALMAAMPMASGQSSGTGQSTDVGASNTKQKQDKNITVMTRNLYLGANLAPVVRAAARGDQPGTIQAVTDVWTNVVKTNFPERAGALAKEIKQSQPQLVNLQEASRYSAADYPDLPSDVTAESPNQAAPDVQYNYLDILLDALNKEGLNYVPVVINKNYDVVLPRYDPSSPTGLENIRLVDRDVILARADLPVSNMKRANFSTNLPLPLKDQNGNPVKLTRGWASVDVTMADKTIRLIDTHLEGDHPATNEAQGNELLSEEGPANTNLPVILAGDFNSPADTGTTYTNLINTGRFVDAWSATHSQEAGLTCCHLPDLSNLAADEYFTKRIDLVLFREGRKAGLSAADAQLVGDKPTDRTVSGLWPSDHAGVVGTLNR
jgi:hypothetical protein